MRELPSRGRCHAAFLLAYTARLKRVPTIGDWVAGASDRSTIMAAALDLSGTAEILCAGGLVIVDEYIVLGRGLARLSFQADRTTLVGIARLLLRRYPPSWIVTSVAAGKFLPELVPAEDLAKLDWLKDDLGPIVLDVHRSITAIADDALRKALGDAAELAVMAALDADGLQPTHVALVSDAYGYDIEYGTGSSIRRLEVKSSVQTTAHRVVISRNEVDKARAFEDSWKLVQVVLSSGVVLRRVVEARDILSVRELTSSAVTELVPNDSGNFRWIESAELKPAAAAWKTSDLAVPPHFSVPLGRRQPGG